MDGDTAYETQPGTLRPGETIEPYGRVAAAAIGETGYELPPDLPPDELKVWTCCVSPCSLCVSVLMVLW